MSQSSAINLRILTTNKQEHEYLDVIEYVQGRSFFYVYVTDGEVIPIPRDRILQVIRFNEIREWPVKLKLWKLEND